MGADDEHLSAAFPEFVTSARELHPRAKVDLKNRSYGMGCLVTRRSPVSLGGPQAPVSTGCDQIFSALGSGLNPAYAYIRLIDKVLQKSEYRSAFGLRFFLKER